MPTEITVAQAIEEYKYAVLKLSPRTQKWYVERLERFADWCAAQGLTLDKVKATHTRRYLEELRQTPNKRTGEPLSSYTIHGHARVLKLFLKWCNKEEGFEDYVSVKATRVDMPKLDKKVVQIFTTEEIKALQKACAKEATPELQARSYAVVSLLYETGIRASELCGLTLDATYLKPGNSFIRVFGKGRKEREVGLGKDVSQALYKYIHRFRRADEKEQHTFLSRTHKPLTVYGLDQVLYRLGDWAGVEDCHAHKFRHSFAVGYLQAGGDLFDLARLMGHSTTEVTKLYLEAYSSTNARQKGISLMDNLK
jgi:site-specific recombinase XerD